MFQLFLVLCVVIYTMDMTSGGPIATDRELQRRYLQKFNHLGGNNPDPRMAELRSSNPEEEFKMAVRSFQRFAGLRMTGLVDRETAAMMEAPRCGVADLTSNMGGVSRRRRKRYTVQGDKWRKNVLTYRIRNHMQRTTMTQQDVRQVLRRAFDIWSEQVPLTFNEVTDNRNIDNLADIEISFGSLEHGDKSPFDGPGQTLAHAYFPGLGIGGDLHFDDDETFTGNTPQGTNLLQVSIHELGHSLGLGHSDNQDAIMAPYYRKYIPENILKLHMDDVNGIKYLYGSKSATTTRRPKPPPVTPEVVTRPPPGKIDTVSNFCLHAQFDAIDVINGVIHAFYGDKYLQLDEEGNVRPGYPKFISEGFPSLPDNLDAVLSLERLGGSVYFFKGPDFWLYNKTRPNDIKRYSIQQGLGTGLNKVDAAFVWGGNGYAYFVKDSEYYRYSLYSRYLYQPRPLSEWKNLPATLDSAFQHPTTGKTYFFSGSKYYIINDMSFSAQSSGDIYDWLHCCSIRLQAYEAGGLRMHAPRSSSLSFATFLVGLLVAFCVV